MSGAASVHGAVDGFEGLYLTGWAIARPDDHTCVIEVRDAAGNKVAGGRATRSRPDLAALGYGRNSFAFRIPLAGVVEAAQFTVTADGIPLHGSPVQAGRGIFDGFIEVAHGHFDGWVTERSIGAAAPRIEVADDAGNVLATVRSTIAADGSDPYFRPARFYLPIPESCVGKPGVMLALQANGVRFGPMLAPFVAVGGALVELSPTRCTGWVGAPDALGRRFTVEAWRGGRMVGSGKANRRTPEADGPKGWHVGFDFALDPPEAIPFREGEHVEIAALNRISLRLKGNDAELFGGPFMVGGTDGMVAVARRAAQRVRATMADAEDRAIAQAALAAYIATLRQAEGSAALAVPAPLTSDATGHHLTVVIPVYRGIEVTRACIQSVLAHRDARRDAVLLINDAAPEPGMAAMLGEFAGQPNLAILTNPENLGFVRTVNRAFAECRSGDVLLLNSDTVMFAGGIGEMQALAHATPGIATVTAMSNNATIFNYPTPNEPVDALPDVGWEELAAVALAENGGMGIEVPTGHGFCMLIHRAALDEVGPFDEVFGRGYGEENEFCQRAADLGYRHLAAGGVLVEHRERASFGAERDALIVTNMAALAEMYPEYDRTIHRFTAEDPLRAARRALDAHRLGKLRGRHASAVLVVGNELGGGTRRFEAEIAAHIGFDGALLLRLAAAQDGRITLTIGDLKLGFAPDEAQATFALLAGLGISRMVVQHVLGFTPGFITAIADFATRLPTIVYLHDFYPVCPRVTMIDALGAFCGGADVDRCGRCVAMGGAHEASRTARLSPADHRVLFARLIGAATAVIVPSADTARWFAAMMPGVAVQVIPHPHYGAPFPAGARDGSAHDIALLGAIGPHKGSAELLRLARHAALSRPGLRFHVIGFTENDEAFADLPNVSITGKYDDADLPGLIAASGARVALFLHVWPETFSYTLSEAVAHGLIPVVPDLGAPADRVRDAGFGAVFPLPLLPDPLLDLLEGLAVGRLAPGEGTPAAFAVAESEARIMALLRDPSTSPVSPPAAEAPRKRSRPRKAD